MTASLYFASDTAEEHEIRWLADALIFIAASDGNVRALDEETGQVLWTFKLPAGSEGIPLCTRIGR